MPYRLREDGVPRYVEVLENPTGGMWIVPPSIDLEPFLDNIQLFRDCINTGRPLPRWLYSRNDEGDRLYEEKNWFHLHVGFGIDDDILLLVEEETEGVLIIGLTDHSIFKERPKAGRFRKFVGGLLARRRQKITSYKPTK